MRFKYGSIQFDFDADNGIVVMDENTVHQFICPATIVSANTMNEMLKKLKAASENSRDYKAVADLLGGMEYDDKHNQVSFLLHMTPGWIDDENDVRNATFIFKATQQHAFLMMALDIVRGAIGMPSEYTESVDGDATDLRLENYSFLWDVYVMMRKQAENGVESASEVLNSQGFTWVLPLNVLHDVGNTFIRLTAKAMDDMYKYYLNTDKPMVGDRFIDDNELPADITDEINKLLAKFNKDKNGKGE